ncbi:hypothetical protein WJX73_000648 [Symbiochloris irregularis]|uniref:DUF659 domain-containing protein n=1 Tax=Symbiochloris irregularis TaxID=706552 RepID=A0AAW1NZH6_9CHLO
MVDLFQSLRPKWLVPGRSKLANLLITFYDAQDFSEEHHTGEFIAEAIYEWALKIGPQKLVAVITDNAPAMVKARRLFVEKEGMGHIIPIRCHMHGVNLCLEGVLVGEFAKNISSQGQVVATFIRASPIAAAKVAAAAKQLNMQGTVLSGNSTRFTSVMCCCIGSGRLQQFRKHSLGCHAITGCIWGQLSQLIEKAKEIMQTRCADAEEAHTGSHLIEHPGVKAKAHHDQ